METLSLTLTKQEVEYVHACLVKRPMEEVRALVAKIEQQYSQQVQLAPAKTE